MTWLEEIIVANRDFREQIEIDALPTRRKPGPYAIVTCMDPRVNLDAVGPTSDPASQVRVIRSLGAITDQRSLLVGIHLAGFREILVMMHTDCGCCLAYSKVDQLLKNMRASLPPEKWARFKAQLGTPLRNNLRQRLHAFRDPRQAVRDEVMRIKAHPVVPDHLIVHGLLYDLSTGGIEIIVNGYGREVGEN